MLLPISYDGTKYKVSFIDACTIWRIQAILFLKRTKRRIKTLIKKEDISLSLFITICWMMYSILIWLIKCDNGIDNLQLNVFGDVLWEIKNSYFTSVVLAFAITVFNRGREHIKLIQGQHTIYVNALYDFDRLFEPILGKALGYMPFYTDDCLRDTLHYIDSHCVKCCAFNDNDYVVILQLIVKRVEKLESLMEKNAILYLNNEDKSMLHYYLNSARSFAYELSFKDKIFLSDLRHLSFELLQILNYLRTPWRCDLMYRAEILRILNEYPEFDLSEHYYERMLLYKARHIKSFVTK